MRIPYHLPQYGPSSFHPLPPRPHPTDLPPASAGLKRKAPHSPERGGSPWHRQRLQEQQQEQERHESGLSRVQQQPKQEKEKQCTLTSREGPAASSSCSEAADSNESGAARLGVGGSRYLLTPADSHPAHFTRGSLIQLASGQMKKVEELDTDDFLSSAAHSPEVFLKVNQNHLGLFAEFIPILSGVNRPEHLGAT